MKFAANLSLLWPELPYLDRFDAAAAAGFKAVEVLFPYEIAAKDTQEALGRNGLELVLINAPPPNYTGGAQGFAAEPEQAARFQHDMRRVFRYATALGVEFVHVMSGYTEGAAARATLVGNMTWAAEAAPQGLTLTLEPLNAEAQPNYYLSDYALAASILKEIDAPNVGLQYDSYHAQAIHGDAVAVFETYLPWIKHIQLGDAPDRTAPGTGTVDFETLFACIEASDYAGWISGEYHPNGRTEKTLAWFST